MVPGANRSRCHGNLTGLPAFAQIMPCFTMDQQLQRLDMSFLDGAILVGLFVEEGSTDSQAETVQSLPTWLGRP